MVEWHHRRITAELMSGDIGMNVKIAFIQLLPEHSLDKNLEIGKNACIEAKEMGADIALFPEMWSDGYYLPQDETELNNLSIDKFCTLVGFSQAFRSGTCKVNSKYGRLCFL